MTRLRRLVLSLLVPALLASCSGRDGGGGPSTAAPAPATSSTVAGETTDVLVYLVRDEKATAVARSVPKVPRVGAEAVKALLAGPTPAEAAAGLSTAVPPGTRFLDLVIENGIARVDLSRQFESGGGTLSVTLRLAQVTCTLDQFETVSGVRFLLDGAPVSAFTGQGVVLEQPVTCAGYREHVAADSEPAFPGIWPFASQAEADSYAAGRDQAFRDPARTAREFAARYVGMRDPVVTPALAGSGVVEVGVRTGVGEGGATGAGPPAMTVFLQGTGPGGQGPWTVVAARAPLIRVDRPVAMARVASPVPLAGAALAFEGNVTVQVREDGMVAGQSLGQGAVTGGGSEQLPFRGEVAFRRPSRPAGAVLFFELSAADGQSVLRATVVRVAFRAT